MAAPLRALIVEGSTFGYEAIVHHLAPLGAMRFTRIDSLPQLESHVSRDAWDTVILDCPLPGFTALEAVRLVRRFNPDVPCVVFSATLTTDGAIELLKNGAQDCIPNGDLARLGASVDEAIRQRELRRDSTRARAQHRDLEYRASQAVERALDAFVGMDDQGAIIDWNPRAEELFGWSREEVLGRFVADTLVPEPMRRPHRDGLERFRQTGEAKVLDRILQLTALKRDGSTLPVELQLSAFPLRNSYVFGAFIRDVSARVRGEKLRRVELDVTKALAASLSLSDAANSVLDILLEGLDWDVGCLRQPEGKSTSLTCVGFRTRGGLPDRRFEELTRELVVHAGEGLPGLVRNQGTAVWVPDLTADERFLRRDFAHAADLHTGVFFPFRVGKEIAGVVELFSRHSLPRDDAMVQTFETVANQLGQFVQRCRTEELLRGSQAQRLHSQKMDSIGRLAGGIAHDFNNLLTVIGGCAEFAMESLAPGHPGRQEIQSVLNATASASSLTRQLIAFSRRQVLMPRVLDLNDVLGTMEKMIRRVIGENIELLCKPAAGLSRVLADLGQIEQVLMNLAVNARDAMPGGGKLTLETANVSLDGHLGPRHLELEPGAYVRLSVTDTGHGIDEENMTRIFEPFFTTKANFRGTGLGLATVFGIVKQSGGGIYAYSEIGHGTTFKVYLPATSQDGSPAPEIVRRPERPAGMVSVLLVEDSADVRRLARNILQRHGYSVLEAASPDEAMRLIAGRPKPIHLLLTDVIMPGMSGKALSDVLRLSMPGLRVLFMSGYTDDALADHGVLPPDVHFLEKPFTPDGLLRKVQDALDRAPAESRGESLPR